MVKFTEWLGALIRPKTDIGTNTRNFTTFRYGQRYTEDDIEKGCRRNGVFKFLTDVIYDFAFTDGLEIRDKEATDEKKARVDDISDELDKQLVLKSLSKVAKTISKYGSATTILFNSMDRWNNNITDIKPFRPKRVRMDFFKDHPAEDIVYKYQLEEILPSPSPPRVTTITYDMAEDYKNVFHQVIFPSDDNWFSGISEIDAVWDYGISHRTLLEAQQVASVRVAFGIRKASLWDTGDPTKNEAMKSRIEGGLRDLESGDTSIVMWGQVRDGQALMDTIEVDTGGAEFNYAEKIDNIHKVLAMITGIPKNYWDGIFQGSTLGAEVALSILESALKERRERYTNVFTDIIRRWCELNSLVWKDSYYIYWLQEESLTEREQAEIENIEVSTTTSLVDGYIITPDEGRIRHDYEGSAPEKPTNDFTLGVDGLNEDEPEEEDDDNE